MKKMILNLLTNVGFILTAVYAFLNLTSVIIYESNHWDVAGWFTDFVLGVDVFTWIVYGIFSIFTLFLKLWSDSKTVNDGSRKNWLDIQSILHFVFMIISFGGIYYMFENSF